MLSQHLALLERAGLIQLQSSAPEANYVFRHGLLQDTAYSTLLKPQRQAWHRACGVVLESLLLDGEASETLAPVLAQHFSIAGDDQRALRYFVRAAEAAFDRYANAEAGGYYAQALRLASSPALYTPALARHIVLRYGRTLELRSQFDAALSHYEAAEALARRQADGALELAVLLEQAKIRSTANLSADPERSRALLEQAAALAERLGDHATQARLYWTLMLQNTMVGGDPAERAAAGERSLSVARELGLREQMAYTLQDLWFANAGQGQWDKSRDTLLEARRLWRELKHATGECETILRLSQVSMAFGDYDEALALAAEGYRIAETIHSADMRALSHVFVGLIYADRGDYAQAVTLTEAALVLGATTGNITVLTGSQGDLGLAYGELGDGERGLTLARAALTLAQAEFPMLASWPAANVARLHLLAGDVAQAAEVMAGVPPFQDLQRRAGFMIAMWMNVALAEGELALAQGQAAHSAALMAEAAATLEAGGLRFRLPEVLYLRGQALLAQGRLAQARSELQAARLEAIALDARRMLWRILAALGSIEDQTGQPHQAAIWRRQAQGQVAYIGEHAPTPELRAAFLSLPSVQAVLHST